MASAFPNPVDVGAYYNRLSPMFGRVVGADWPLHVGFHDEPGAATEQSLRRAADRLTDALIGQLDLSPGQHLLDVGCGNGHPALRIARATGAQVTGITISREQVKTANDNAATAGLANRVRFQKMNAMELTFDDDTFDAAWAVESLMHMPDPAVAMREVRRVLAPGGRFAVANFASLGALPAELIEQHVSTGCVMWPLEAQLEHARSAGLEILHYEDVTERVRSYHLLAADVLETRAAEFEALFGPEFVVAGLTYAMIYRRYIHHAGYITMLLGNPAGWRINDIAVAL